MYLNRARFLVCFAIVAGVLLVVVFGLASPLDGAITPSGVEPYALGQSSDLSTGHSRHVVLSSPAVTETVYLPVLLRIPAGNWLTIWTDSQRAPAMREIASRSKLEYGVELVVRAIPSVPQAILTAHLSDLGPDIFVFAHDRLGEWLELGVVVPIELGPKRSDFVPVALDAFTNNGELLGLPYAYENMGLFRNADLVKNAPSSWNELLAEGQSLKSSGQVSYSLTLEDNGYKVYPIVTTHDGYVFGRASNGTWMTDDLGINESGMISAGNWISESVGAGFIPSEAYDAAETESLFVDGHVPYILTGPWSLGRFRDANVNYAISNFPDGGQPFVSAQGFMINAHSHKQDLSKAFLTEYIATPEIMELLFQNENRPPAYKPLLDSIDDPDLVALSAAGRSGALMPAVPEMGCVWGSWNAAVVRILTLQEKPRESLDAAAAEIRSCVDKEFKGMVNVPGTYQQLAGCERDWDPACLATAMTATNGLYTSTHILPAGDYEVKVALDGNWAENYGLHGIRDGDNIPFSLSSAGPVIFTYDPITHILSIETGP